MNPLRTATGLIQLPAHAAPRVEVPAQAPVAAPVDVPVDAAHEPRTPATEAAPGPATKAPAKETPAKKAAARKAPSRKAAVVAPALGLSESEAVDLLRTPSGIPAAGDGINPDTAETDLHQPSTEPLMDPSITKAVASESAML